MRIAYLTSEYPPLASGGIGVGLQNVARGLVRRGHQVYVVGVGQDADFDDEGVAVSFRTSRYLPHTGWLAVRVGARSRLRRLVRDKGVQLVVAPDYQGLSAGLHPGCPVAVRCNASTTFLADGLGYRPRLATRVAERIALRGATAITAVSHHVAERTTSLFDLRQPITVIPNGVAMDRFPQPGPPSPEPVAAFVGSVKREKGVLDVCHAFGAALAEVPQARLVVAGRDLPDPATDATSTWTLCEATLGPDHLASCDRVGPVPVDEVPGVFRRARVVVVPSYLEACPNVWLEAMAAGRAVVGYAHPWAVELVTDGLDGLLVPPGDVHARGAALRRGLTEPGLAERLGAAARRTVEARFTAERMVDDLEAFFASVAEPNREGGAA